MPIPAEFSTRYANEAEFTDRFMVPLLHRMGFSIVVNYHHDREFGKDLVFADVNQFGHVVYHGLQVKFQGSVSQGDSHGLVEDCNEAFTNPFEHPQMHTKERIAIFYVANAGSISPNARDHFFRSLDCPHGGHVRLLDGQALLALDRWATYSRVEAIGAAVSGLRWESSFNLLMIEKFTGDLNAWLQDTSRGLPTDRFRLQAVSDYLVRPYLPQRLKINTVVNAWHYCEVTNRWLDFAANPLRGKDNQRTLIESSLETCRKVHPLFLEIQSAGDEILKELGPIAAY